MDYQNKSREELIEELELLKKKPESSEAQISEKVRRLESDLGEQRKELNCHILISELMNRPGFSIDEVCNGIVRILLSSWQFAEIAEAAVFIRDKIFKTTGYIKCSHSLSSDIIVNQEIIGKIDVFYPVKQIQRIYLIQKL